MNWQIYTQSCLHPAEGNIAKFRVLNAVAEAQTGGINKQHTKLQQQEHFLYTWWTMMSGGI